MKSLTEIIKKKKKQTNLELKNTMNEILKIQWKATTSEWIKWKKESVT